MKAPKLSILGVMSGSSLDGLDLAICQFDRSASGGILWEIIDCASIPFDTSLKSRLLAAYTCSSAGIYAIEQEFTEFCGSSVIDFLASKAEVDYIGFHGHTIFHEPQLGYTVQIGNGISLSQLTHINVVGKVREQDIALGGQGAPIAPTVEKYLFPEYNIFLNLGGIVNISMHDSTGEISAYDITACNQALNHLAQKMGLEYDDQGILARSGQLNLQLLEHLNQLNYLNKQPPKSLSNTWVQQQFIPILEEMDIPISDKLHTCVIHMAQQIAKSIPDSFIADKVLATGGGGHNTFLIDSINNHLENRSVVLPTRDLIDNKEALLMALMAYLRVNELPNSFSSVTGASRDSCGGVIYRPRL